MGYRRKGKTEYARDKSWADWCSMHSSLIATAALPDDIIGSEDTWWYFLQHAYSQAWYQGCSASRYGEDLSLEQREALWEFITLTVQEYESVSSKGFSGELEILMQTFGPAAGEPPQS